MNAAAARAAGFAALGGFGLLHWMAMVEPAEPLRAAAALAVALAVTLVATARPVLLVLVLPATLVAGGVAPADLWPGRWDDLARSISAGVEGVGGARVPYGGSDPDIRMAIGLGGAVLVVSAALLAAHSRAAGLVALGFLYGIPAVAVDFGLEFARGALLALVVLLYLRLERVRAADVVPAAGLAGAGAVLALAAGPALDGDRPWFDYESFARDSASAKVSRFDWQHDYGALPWPRDGREVLQVQSPRRTYWKVQTLDYFDGRRWRTDPVPGAPPAPSAQMLGVTDANRDRWTFPIGVSVRSLSTEAMPLAAVARSVTMEGRDVQMTAPGSWSAGRDLHRGDAYRAQVYVPQPTREELEAAPPDYPVWVVENLSFNAEVPGDVGGTEPIQLRVYGYRAGPRADFYDARYAAGELRRSSVSGAWALSRRLLAGADTPYAYARSIRRHLGRGFTYDETPSRAARTLDGFLTEARSGFCQQYSGAMALLLRMGGVPARVATGFAPGSYDERSDRYLVRDLDAHSWVEAWFGGIGWVVFDPTPTAAPPRSQALPNAVSAGTGDIRDRGTTLGAPPAPEERNRRPVLLLVLGLALAAGAYAVSRIPRRVPAHELERALRGAGEPFAPQTTLLALEDRLGPGAGAYLRALRAERFAGGPGPTRSERRGLRRALARGRRPLARVRAWLALRPRLGVTSGTWLRTGWPAGRAPRDLH